MMPPMWMLLWLGCAPPHPRDSAAALDTGGGGGAVPVRWVPTAGEPWEEARAGLWWGLAGLGASPTSDAISAVRADGAGRSFVLHVDRLGLDPAAEAALHEGLAPVRAARLDQGLPHVELGRLLQRTLYEPWVYYAVTGACADLDAWSRRLPQDSTPVAITDSLLTEGDRRLRFAPAPDAVAGIAWAAEEGEGSLADGTFRARATEVVDVMPNGRFRYAVYDDAGGLVPGADPAHSPAGQPGRCMWCHENHLMTTIVQPDLPGHLPFEGFVEAIGEQQAQVETHRSGLGGGVDWTTPGVHTWGEILVEGFLRAPTARLAAEWSVPEATVLAWMDAVGATPLQNEEYPGWGTVWSRADADAALAAHRATLPAAHPLAGDGAGGPLAVLPSARTLPAPGAAFWVAPTAHACAVTGARRGPPE